MNKRDDALNGRDFAAVDEVHQPDVIADATGRAEPIYGKEAYAAFIQQQVLGSFPNAQTMTPYPIRFGSGDWITMVTRSAGELTLPDGTVIPPDQKGLRGRVRPDHQVGRRPDHRHLRHL